MRKDNYRWVSAICVVNLCLEQGQKFLHRAARCKSSCVSWLAKCRHLATTIRASVLVTALTGFISVGRAQSPVTLDYPGSSFTSLRGINKNGQIVGESLGSNGGGFLYEAGAFSIIGAPAGYITFAGLGISDSGEIVAFDIFNNGTTQSYLDNGGAFTPIVYPGASDTLTAGISSNGAYVVGNYGVGILLGVCCNAFLYTAGGFTQIQNPSFSTTSASGVNNSGQIVGSVGPGAFTIAGNHGFLYQSGAFTLLDFPGAIATFASGINDYGTIVGSYTTSIILNSQIQYHGFVYNNGIFTSFDFPGAVSTSANGVNNDGAIVGSYADSAGNYHGFFYPGGVRGYLNPKYLIMGVTYAPPGGNASSVSYQTTNVVGNSSTNSSSFADGVTVTTSVSAGGSITGVFSGKVTATQSSGWTQKTTTSNQVTINKTSSITFKTPGVPNVYSPVDHDYDIIWLWLNPATIFTLPNTNIGGPILWNGYGYDLNDPLQDIDVWPIYVGYLNGDFGLLDPQDADALARSWASTQTFGSGQGPGITSSDFPNILKADPFANNPNDANSGYVLTLVPGTSPATSMDGRFTASSPNNAAPQSIPYAQAPPNSTQGIQATYQSVYSTITQATQVSDVTYKVGYSVDVNIGSDFLGFTQGADFREDWSLTWENVSQTQNTNTTTQTDTAVITGPPCPATTAPCNPEYTEPHEFAVYQDNLYGTFMFWPNPYFSISKATPATNTVAAGGTVTYTVPTQANAGYKETSISFSVTGLPAGASFNQSTVEPGSPFALILNTTSTTPTGSYPLTISATDGAQSSFTYATLVVNAADFALSSTPSSVTVPAGNSAPLTVTVTPQGSFTNSITFLCSGLPALASCTFNPSAVTPNANTATSTLTITTGGRTAFLAPRSIGRQVSPLYATALVLFSMLLGMVGLTASNRRRALSYVPLSLLVGGCLLLASCAAGGGGGGGNGTGNGGSPGTPAGAYTITVTGVAGSTQHTTKVTLTVQ